MVTIVICNILYARIKSHFVYCKPPPTLEPYHRVENVAVCHLRVNQRKLLELNRQARDWVLELRLYKALAQAIKPLQKQTYPQPIQVEAEPWGAKRMADTVVL